MTTQARAPALPRCGLDALDQFDELIDVRSPAEYADDHIPGAISAPVLDNDERARIGTIYVQESAFKANRLGAALVARHIAEHLQGQFADRPRTWRPLIYCWRGGKRSGAMASWFRLIGWRAVQLEGGYKRWRRHVIDTLQARPAQLRFIVLAGPTGSGKTRLLHALAQIGAQTLDLEALARHRGSLLGALPDCPQPSQRAFETALLQALDPLDPQQPVFVEAESRRIGHVSLPNALMDCVRAAPCVRVHAAMAQRVAFLMQDYAHLFEAPDAFKQALEQLIGLHSRETVRTWQALIDADRRAELFEALVIQHYDPAYARSSQRNYIQLGQATDFLYDPTRPHDLQQARALLQAASATPVTLDTQP